MKTASKHSRLPLIGSRGSLILRSDLRLSRTTKPVCGQVAAICSSLHIKITVSKLSESSEHGRATATLSPARPDRRPLGKDCRPFATREWARVAGMFKATFTVSLQKARLGIMGTATNHGASPVEGDHHVTFYQPLSTKCLSLILDVFSTIPAASGVSANHDPIIPFAHQDGLDGKQPGPS